MVSQLLIEKANISDFNSVLVLSIKLWLLYNRALKNGKLVKQKKLIKEAINKSLVLVAKNKDKKIGYILCEFLGSKHAYFPNSIFISELWVEPEYRNKGVGNRLIKTVLRNKYPSKYLYFSLTHDPNEQWLSKFYKKFGFIEEGVTDKGNFKMRRDR